MSNFIVTYDLLAPDKDYEELISAIKDYGTYSKVTESCWIIKSSKSSSQILEHLKNHIDFNDRLFVAQLTRDVSWHKIMSSEKWLQTNI